MVSFDTDECEQPNEIIYCKSKKEAKKIGAKLLNCEPQLLKAELKQIHTKESTRQSTMSEKLSKYRFTSIITKKLLKHLTEFEEYIDVPCVKTLGEIADPTISIEYTFDEISYIVGFDLDYSGNNKHFIWDDDFEYDDETDLHFIFRDTICNFLDTSYT